MLRRLRIVATFLPQMAALAALAQGLRRHKRQFVVVVVGADKLGGSPVAAAIGAIHLVRQLVGKLPTASSIAMVPSDALQTG
jgi:hypothetical protein